MARHRRTRRQLKKQRKIIIISLICFMFIMVGGYAAFQTNLNITAKGNIKEKSRVIQSWTSTSNEDFHTDYYRENIVTATFLDDARVPSNAVDSWDVSVDKDKGVMAWVVPNSEDGTKYDLYIGANKGVIANENSSNLFYNFSNLTSIEFGENFDTSSSLSMKEMFYGCRSLAELDVSSFDTSNVTNMHSMFSVDTNLTLLDLSSFDTSNVTNMGSMFSFWDGNYRQSSKLKNIIFSDSFNTSKVTNMNSMFYGCNSLESLDLSIFDTSAVIDMFHMFQYDSSLTELNLCSFDTRRVKSMDEMFGWTSNLKNIYVGSNWDTSQATVSGIFWESGVSSVTTGQC